ncbi:hypothetical protein BDV25DRAFT_163469 [Aspergillus avenaceus]|uniref:Uncharacterized protein n=1 Tax=Aspergillus avenaceus TaxID=36643 RepID=A0A5N6THZ6_ASPAV|nr:hypothetical protein BDV25DRAFT_163469 [Aspergillus avenaceus]
MEGGVTNILIQSDTPNHPCMKKTHLLHQSMDCGTPLFTASPHLCFNSFSASHGPCLFSFLFFSFSFFFFY